MKMNHLQSLKQANKMAINAQHEQIAYTLESLRHYRRMLKADRALLVKMVAVQKDIKGSINNASVARAAGPRRKHNRSDPRYAAWYTAQHSANHHTVTVTIGTVPVGPCSC